MRLKDDLFNALLKEIEWQKSYLKGALVQTIYLGGGTPSVLTADELNRLFAAIHAQHTVAPDAEITLEANPDDLSQEYIQTLKSTPINRLSIGIQSFAEEDLRWMNRAHNALEAKMAIEYAQDAGYDNLTVDLIYGAPTTTDAVWLQNLQTVFDYDIPHISCYALTVEADTALDRQIQKGKNIAPQEETAARHFELLMSEMRRYGYLHYEISNFAQPNHLAKHNTNYWLGVPYLGIGPSAHSFDGKSRQWNISNNAMYIRNINDEKLPFTREELSTTQRYNEYVMTSMRTMWGCDPNQILEKFGKKYLTYFNKRVIEFVKSQTVTTDGKKYFLSEEGRLFADRIAMELFFG